tara:strand:- start:6931 stop:7335 length:405 start_codon:yes stop_codon:yes gene_type:complete
MANVTSIEGIAATSAKKLEKAGITTVAQLLEACKDKRGRKKVATASGLDEGKLLKWTNHADLCRISGVAGQYAELLEAAGIDSVKELARRRPQSVFDKLIETNSGRKKPLVNQTPALSRVENWVEQAKELKLSS